MTTLLPSAIVQRAGVTAGHWSEVPDPDCRMVLADGALCIRFSIAAAGGGTTEIQLRLGAADLGVVLRNLAAEWPGASEALLGAGMIAASTQQAALASLQTLVGRVAISLDSWNMALTDRPAEGTAGTHLDEEWADCKATADLVEEATTLTERAGNGAALSAALVESDG